MPAPPLPRCRFALPLALVLALGPLARADGPPVRPAPAGKVDFNRDVRPVLSDHCFACHGPDAKKRKGGLRLDVENASAAAAVAPGPGGKDGELVGRLLTDDASKRMPPAKFKKPLTPQQIDLLRRWAAQGGRYSAHWAYVAPRRPALPPVRNAGWPRNAVDRFILARLESAHLSPSPEADRTTLLRRVTLDLTGLPPTLAEIDAFLADRKPGAYERVVDRLLGSARYGEHMARFWLDLARFGDTHGMHLDNYREMWPYRDWVLRAFNANKPYDRFVTEQLAGDLLAGSRLEDLVATGFNRAHVTTSEGGSITEEVHIRNVLDRVETTGTVFLGLTVGCARCHDHKYDPVTQKDFYSLSAFFNSLQGSPLDGNAARHPPVVSVPTAEQTAALAALDQQVLRARKALAAKAAGIAYDDRLDENKPEQPGRSEFVWIDDELPAGAKGQTDGRDSRWNFVGAPAPVFSGKRALRHSGNGTVQHYFTEAKPGLMVGAGDTLFAHVYLDPKSPPKQVMLQWNTGDWRHRAYWGANLIPFGRDKSTERRHMGPLPKTGQWVKLEVPAAKVGLKPGVTVSGWAFTQFDGVAYWDRAGIRTQTPQAGAAFETLSGWVRAQRAAKGAGLPPEINALVKTARAKRTPAQQKQLRDYFVANAWSKARAALEPLRQELVRLEAARRKVEQATPITYVFKETPTPLQAYVLKRGEYDQRGAPVGRETPGFLPPLPEGAPKNRLGLAKWMLSAQHPLAARVAVNRYWQQVFGVGLVKTAEDFGVQGEPPSHPELLDHLAVEFREGGWDVKRLMRLLVSSAAYRQSSRVTKDRLAADPHNRLLSRGPRFRLDAEVLRDQALAVSGLLVERLGGPSVKPPQPPGLWRAVAFVGSNTMNFTPDRGPDKVYRRGVYTFWKRTSPPPQMTTFDAPSREACTVRRERTNTPLQALLLLNEPQYVGAARHLAGRALREGGKTTAGRISHLFRLAAARRPDAKELAELTAALADLRAEYRANPAAAAQLAAAGGAKPEPGVAAADLAAWTMLASTVLNLDEVLNKG
jgi:mono/diheme cytochrome c family protein